VKRKPQHLEKHHILEFSNGSNGGTLKLRVGPDGSGAGFDVKFAREAPRVRMLRVTDQASGANGANGGEQPFDVDAEDAQKLIALHGKLAKGAAELAGHRKRLVDAKLDGEAMRSHAKPTLLPERLIATMAPVVQEISARSHSPGELILRRLLGGDRRACVARELTKPHEEILRDSVEALAQRYATQRPLGEVTLVVAGAAEGAAAEDLDDDEVLEKAQRLIADGQSTSDAARALAEMTGRPRRDVYKLITSARDE